MHKKCKNHMFFALFFQGGISFLNLHLKGLHQRPPWSPPVKRPWWALVETRKRHLRPVKDRCPRNHQFFTLKKCAKTKGFCYFLRSKINGKNAVKCTKSASKNSKNPWFLRIFSTWKTGDFVLSAIKIEAPLWPLRVSNVFTGRKSLLWVANVF